VGDPVEVNCDSADDFHQLLEDAGHSKAEKLHLWTLQIPISHVPPLIVAVAAISSATDSSTLAQMDEDLLRILMKCEEPLCIVSIGSDGAISERKAHQDLFTNLIHTGEGQTKELHINHPDGHSPPVMVSLLQVFGQSSKTQNTVGRHCRTISFQEQELLSLHDDTLSQL
jgi:hypothetical protein